MKFWPQPVNLHPIFCKCALVGSLFLFGAERIFLATLDAVGLRPATMLSLLLSAGEETHVSNEIFHHLLRKFVARGASSMSELFHHRDPFLQKPQTLKSVCFFLLKTGVKHLHCNHLKALCQCKL